MKDPYRSLVLPLVILVALAAGCTSTPDDKSSQESEDKSAVIGLSQRRLAGSDWWAVMIQGAEDKAAELGVELIITDAGGDTVKQNSDVQTLLTQGVDAIIMNPHDPTGVSSAVAAINSEKLPLVVVNNNLSEELAESQYCYVAENQIEVAAGLGSALGELAKERFQGEKVTAVVVGGYSGEPNTVLRNEGVLQGYAAVEGAPEIEYLPIRYGEWLPDRALGPVRDIATANPDLKIVVSLSDVMLPGIQQGLKDAGILDQVLIGSYDGQMSVLKAMMDDPSGPVQVNASNEPYKQGQLAVEKALDAINGVPQDEACPGGEFWIDTFLATPETAIEFYDPEREF